MNNNVKKKKCRLGGRARAPKRSPQATLLTTLLYSYVLCILLLSAFLETMLNIHPLRRESYDVYYTYTSYPYSPATSLPQARSR